MIEQSKSQLAKLLELERLPPGQAWTIDAARIEPIGIQTIRERCSRINLEFGANLRVHKYPTGEVGIWHDPAARKIQINPIVGNMLELKTRYNKLIAAYKQKQDVVLLDEMSTINDQINEILAKLKTPTGPKFNKGGAIRQPLKVILAHVGLTADEWECIPGRDQTRIRIRAELEIKAKQTEEER